MNVHDYLIDHAAFDWQELLGCWHWRMSGEMTIWLMNRFGDLFVTQDDGSISRLRLDDGTFARIAKTKDEFLDLVDQPDFMNDWLMIPLVDRLVAAGKILGRGQCYAFVQIPILGGDYAIENIVVRDIARQYKAMGPLHEKLKDIPDGTKISFQIEK